MLIESVLALAREELVIITDDASLIPAATLLRELTDFYFGLKADFER